MRGTALLRKLGIFDAAGRQVNARFGKFTTALNQRMVQLALPAYF
jgi:hypothetical protein